VSDDALRALAHEAGVAVEWQNYTGEPRAVTPEVLRKVLDALGYPCGNTDEIEESRHRLGAAEGFDALPPLVTAIAGRPLRLTLSAEAPRRVRLLLESGAARDIAPRETHNGFELPAIAELGYHRLLIGEREIVLAVAPDRATSIAQMAPGGRIWGLAAQIYGLRRDGDGGIGDALSVAALAESAARHGADALVLSPVDALFLAQPERYGPYSPSSRLFLNPLHAAPGVLFDEPIMRQAVETAGVGGEMQRLEALPLIDWPAASAAKQRLLRALFTIFANGTIADHALRADFARFQVEGGALLAGHACFEALHAEQLAAIPRCEDWRIWPSDLRDPEGATVAAFVQAHQRDISFHMFLQWIADRSFGLAQRRARAAGMRIGLISDLAVGMDPSGSHSWSRQKDVLVGLTIGAPPDLFNSNGQQWGITTFSPHGLGATGFAPFLATLRAALRNAGGVRIDHAMGLLRLWLVPEGESPADGAYLAYPLIDMLRLVALESQRHSAIVVGEDLGTVPGGFRERMEDHGVYGMRVLWFERDGAGFVTPEHWDQNAIAMTTTHDLPTAASWWLGADIALRAKHGMLGPHQRPDVMEAERKQERAELWRSFCSAGVAEGTAPPHERPEPFVDAAIRFVARTTTPLALLPLEDVLGSPDQPNLPGTTDQHPNWRRRSPRPVDELLDDPAAARRLADVAAERPRG
jgi:4-alpha-glucanotransferase